MKKVKKYSSQEEKVILKKHSNKVQYGSVY